MGQSKTNRVKGLEHRAWQLWERNCRAIIFSWSMSLVMKNLYQVLLHFS